MGELHLFTEKSEKYVFAENESANWLYIKLYL